MLGYSQAHIVCATMEDEKVTTNYVARKLKKLYQDTFEDVKKEKPGFRQVLKEQDIEAFHQ
jgi:hypothetical protein